MSEAANDGGLEAPAAVQASGRRYVVEDSAFMFDAVKANWKAATTWVAWKRTMLRNGLRLCG